MSNSYINLRIWRLIQIFSLWLAVAFAVPTAAISRVPQKLGFVVGINDYIHFSDEKDLSRPVNDANAVKETLAELNYKIESPLINPTRQAFLDRWQDFTRKILPHDTVFVYISGHGQRISGVNYFLPSDVRYLDWRQREKIKHDSIPIYTLFEDVSARYPHAAIFIIDACRDDPYLDDKYKIKGVAQSGLGLAIEPANEAFVIYAALPGQAAIEKFDKGDDSKYSLFTRYLLPLLRQPKLPITELAKKVRKRVHLAAREKGRSQTPTYLDNMLNDFCLGGCGKQVENAQESVQREFDEAGFFARTSLRRGERLQSNLLVRGKGKNNFARDIPENFDEHVRGACLIRPLKQSSLLNWNDMGICR